MNSLSCFPTLITWVPWWSRRPEPSRLLPTTLDTEKVSDTIEPLFPKSHTSKRFPWHGWAPKSTSTTNWIPVPFWKIRRQWLVSWHGLCYFFNCRRVVDIIFWLYAHLASFPPKILPCFAPIFWFLRTVFSVPPFHCFYPVIIISMWHRHFERINYKQTFIKVHTSTHQSNNRPRVISPENPLPSVCLLGGGDERERKSVVEWWIRTTYGRRRNFWFFFVPGM
jgi:hypothetical protein